MRGGDFRGSLVGQKRWEGSDGRKDGCAAATVQDAVGVGLSALDIWPTFKDRFLKL